MFPIKKYINRSFSALFCLILLLGFCPVSTTAAELNPISSTAAILVDLEYDTMLYGKNINVSRAPASITKIMTAIVILEAIENGELSLDTEVTVSESAFHDIGADSSNAGISPGDVLTIDILLHCMLIPSANEASNILAEALCGNITDFVALMNEKALELGMVNTHFMNPHGLDEDGHVSTAYDIFLMTKEAMTYTTFLEIVSTTTYTVPATETSAARLYYNTNALLSNWKYVGYTYSYAIGVKTGYTDNAGYCLVSAAQKSGRTLISVVLGAETLTFDDGTIDRQQFSESKDLLVYGFAGFSHQTLLSKSSLLSEIPVTYGKDVSYVLGEPASTISATVSTDYDASNVVYEVTFYEDSVTAPVSKGDVLGEVSVSYAGTNYGTVELIAVSDVSLSIPRMVLGKTVDMLTSLLFWVIVILIFAVVFIRYKLSVARNERRLREEKLKNKRHED